MGIAKYLRLSESDGDLGIDGKDESNSIENQRLLLDNYIEAREDLVGEVYEYVDDGFSGTNFDRPAFKRMIEDAKKGIINCIVVKDLSRLGRDYIVAGDYIEQIFPLLQVRFIAANNGYDSAKTMGQNAGFDVAISNLINTFYSRDLSKKLKAANKVRWKNGVSTSGHAPFGYEKSKEVKGKFVIDPEAAEIVRFIFDQAIAGNTTSEIALQLNQKGYPTPWVYNSTRRNWKMSEPITAKKERLWDGTKVGSIIRKYDYTGAMVMGRSRVLAVGSKMTRTTSKSEWTIVEGIHEPIVTHEEYEEANLAIRDKRRPDFVIGQNYPLKGKVRCGNCRMCLGYQVTTYKEYFVCRHGRQVDRFSECCKDEYPVKHVESVVWNALKDFISTIEWLGNKASTKAKEQVTSIKKGQKAAEAEISKLKAERVRQYEFYAEGVISKEEYIKKKKALTDQIEELETQQHINADRIEFQKELLDDAVVLRGLSSKFCNEDKLTRKAVLALIDAVYVYDLNRIEIVFQYEDEIRKLMKSLESED